MALNSQKTAEADDAPVFTVDTHLFRELGNHLVGRESTALIELVKNSYDADATEVVVAGANLNDREKGVIIVEDNGVGMTKAQFRDGFLRIASRVKEEGDRRSPGFGRRYTGSKGIGRLAAHKLAETLFVKSVSGQPGEMSRTAIEATIDWRAIEAQPTLDRVKKEVTVTPLSLPKPERTGTRIELSQLRKAWTDDERSRFVQECKSLQTPESLLLPLHPSLLGAPLLFDAPLQRQTSFGDQGFRLRLEGDFDTGDSYWVRIASTAEWVIEIDASRPNRRKKAIVRYGIAPTKRRTEGQTDLKPEIYPRDRPNTEVGPFFQARILVQVDPKGTAGERKRIRQESGIRVYLEGFRVLPYGEEGNDWLSLDSDYSHRSTLSNAAEIEKLVGATEKDPEWKNLFLPNRSFFGAVFITQEGSDDLTPLINREGFLPNASYYDMVKIVRFGINLFTRVRAASDTEERAQERAKRRKGGLKPTNSVLGTIESARGVVQKIQVAVTTSDTETSQKGITELSEIIGTLRDDVGDIFTEADLLRITASVGTQMGEFVHEVQTLLGTAQTVHDALDRLRQDRSLSHSVQVKLGAIHSTIADMRKQLERLASYLLDIATPDATRRRSKQKLSERFDTGVRLVARAAEKRGIEIRNEISPELKSPPMFPAELTTLFSNLLTNAVKNAGEKGEILATGRKTDSGIVVKVQNTGNSVDLENSEKLFRPYVSTSTQIDPTLGQGMGLGLPITRSTLERYGARISFVKPDDGFATAIQIIFPV
jgi:signal transduction histidine kinase